MVRGIYRLILLFCPLILIACSESEIIPNYSLTLQNDSVEMAIGKESAVEFAVSPYDTEFAYDLNSSDCNVKIQMSDGGAIPPYLVFDRIEPIYDSGNSPIKGKYKLFLKDLSQRVNYDLNFEISVMIGGGQFVSARFNVKLSNYTLTQKLLDTGLTLLKIETVNGEEPTCDYVSPPPGGDGRSIKNATKVPGSIVVMKDSIVLFNSGEFEKDKSGLTIKIRGNTSAYGRKKPYKIKLQKKADLLLRDDEDYYKDKDWILLTDESLRTCAGFKVNELLGMQWTPSWKYVNVVINGDYRGVYMLVESVKRNKKCRLDVDESGFIFEMDAYWWNEDVRVMSPLFGGGYTFKYPDPDDITEQQIFDFASIISSFENSIVEGSFYDYIDVDSFVSWLLAQEILGNKDPGGSNIFLTLYDNSESSKIKMGNLWDFDNVFRTPGWWCRQHEIGIFCFGKLLHNNEFVNMYKYKWKEVEPWFFDAIESFVSSFALSAETSSLDASLLLDGQRWDVERESVSARIEAMNSWFKERRIWLSTAIEGMGN